MVDSMDWRAAMDSEIFREYARTETLKIKAEEQAKLEKAEKSVEEDAAVLEQFAEFERQVRTSPKQLEAFRTLQKKFATDPEYTAKVKASFVEAVMSLNLDF